MSTFLRDIFISASTLLIVGRDTITPYSSAKKSTISSRYVWGKSSRSSRNACSTLSAQNHQTKRGIRDTSLISWSTIGGLPFLNLAGVTTLPYFFRLLLIRLACPREQFTSVATSVRDALPSRRAVAVCLCVSVNADGILKDISRRYSTWNDVAAVPNAKNATFAKKTRKIKSRFWFGLKSPDFCTLLYP